MANSSARQVLDVGSVIADTYKIEALVGRGGMGAVFLASHTRLPGKKVAIKLLHAELVGDEILARFRREAEIATRLGHPNIVAVHDFNLTPDGTPYLVLEYLEGATLAQKIAAGPLPLDQVMSIVRQVGSALQAAHREGIVHRDLKPQNIFLVPTELEGRIVEIVKVLDFGISKIRGSQTVKTQESALLGTPQYMAPEQATGRHDSVDERTDVFALGAIVYEMLCGHPAFTGASIPEVVFKVVYERPAPMSREVPQAITDAIQRAMAKPADERFSSVNDFVEALTGTQLARPQASMLPLTAPAHADSAEAHARTIDSGDHAANLQPPAIAAARNALASAETIDSGSRPISAPAAPDQGVAPSRSDVVPIRKARTARTARWVLGVLVVGGVAAAIVATIAGDEQAERPAPAADDDSPLRAATEPGPTEPGPTIPDRTERAPTTELAPRPTEPAAGSAESDDAPPADARVVAKQPPREPPPERTVELTAAETEAEAAFRSGDFDRLHKLANALISDPERRPRLQARGYALRAMAWCGARPDEDKARAALRQLRRGDPLRRRALQFCTQRGYLNGVP